MLTHGVFAVNKRNTINIKSLFLMLTVYGHKSLQKLLTPHFTASPLPSVKKKLYYKIKVLWILGRKE